LASDLFSHIDKFVAAPWESTVCAPSMSINMLGVHSNNTWPFDLKSEANFDADLPPPRVSAAANLWLQELGEDDDDEWHAQATSPATNAKPCPWALGPKAAGVSKELPVWAMPQGMGVPGLAASGSCEWPRIQEVTGVSKMVCATGPATSAGFRIQLYDKLMSPGEHEPPSCVLAKDCEEPTTPRTPKKLKRRSSEEGPPSGPSIVRRRCAADIAEALRQKSVPLLALAFSSGHRCSGGAHCISEAVAQKNVAALELLLSHGGSHADVDEFCRGRRPVHAALQHCIVEGDIGYQMLELLLQHGACPDFIPGDCNGEGPLHAAVRHGNLLATTLLLRHHADVNGLDVSGSSPLHAACKPALSGTGCVLFADVEGTLRQLLCHGANPFLCDNLGLPPIRYARSGILRVAMSEAETLWSRSALRLAWGREEGQAGVAWQIPELLDRIGDFL